MHYQEKLDKIFADGNLWKHRTFRTVLDPFGEEYKHTSLEEKVEIVKKCVDNNLNLLEIVVSYKEFYKKQNNTDVVKSTEYGLINLITEMSKSN